MKSCLVVDDSKVVRMVARKILEGLNFQIVEAENGKLAMEECAKQMPDAILLDWNMPVLDGVEFVREIRGSGNKVPIVMITSVTDSEKILQAAAAGVNSYVEKPIRGPQLWDQIAMFFKHAGF